MELMKHIMRHRVCATIPVQFHRNMLPRSGLAPRVNNLAPAALMFLVILRHYGCHSHRVSPHRAGIEMWQRLLRPNAIANAAGVAKQRASAVEPCEMPHRRRS